MADVWNIALNPSNEAAPIYSNNNTTATSISTGVSYVQNLTPKSSGKWYSELLVTYPGPALDQLRVGIVSNASVVAATFNNNLIGENIFSISWSSKGNVENQNFVSTATPYNSGDVLGIACDFDNNRVWFRTNGGSWSDGENTSNSASDPTNLIGGDDISFMASLQKFIGAMLADGSSINIGILQFPPPNGFLPWLNNFPYTTSNTTVVLPPPIANGIIYYNTYSLQASAMLKPLITTNSWIYDFNPDDVFLGCACGDGGAQARVNLFDMPRVIKLVLAESGVANPVLMNYPVNRCDFILVRGVPNFIQFFVNDLDRYPPTTALANATLQLNIVDTRCQQILMTRQMSVVNSATCLYGISTEPSDTIDWQTGFLQYSVIATRSDGCRSLLYTDRYNSPYGVCNLIDGLLPDTTNSMILFPHEFSVQDGFLMSSPVPGAIQKGYPDGTQSFSFSTNNYTANVAIQGSLIAQPASVLQDWFDVEYQTFIRANGVTNVTVDGNYLWLRVKMPHRHIMPYPGSKPLPNPLGNVSQIIYSTTQ